jgi:hypothetical protein
MINAGMTRTPETTWLGVITAASCWGLIKGQAPSAQMIRRARSTYFIWRWTQFLPERFGSGDGEGKTLLTRQIAFEPLPASVLFAFFIPQD